MKFENWFYENENFNIRAERFWDDMYDVFGMIPESEWQLQGVKRWLEAAYEAGRKHEREDAALTRIEEKIDSVLTTAVDLGRKSEDGYNG